jgi:hypothetical protein
MRIIFRGREMKAREPRSDLSTALTITAFCRMFCITPELYRPLERTGLGPREVRIGDVRFGAHNGLKSNTAPCPRCADSVAKVFLSHRSRILRAVGAAIES